MEIKCGGNYVSGTSNNTNNTDSISSGITCDWASQKWSAKEYEEFKSDGPTNYVIGPEEGFSYEGASKNDVVDQKPDMSLLPEVFLAQVARAMMAGEKKYGTFNYLKGHKLRQLTSAIVRHAKKIEEGEWFDQDTSDRLDQPVTHFACIAANCLMALHQKEEGTLIDNTYKGITKE